MDTNRQIFRNSLATTRAILRRAFRVDSEIAPTSVFCFVGAKIQHHSPGNICNALVNGLVPVGLHPVNVELFKDDQAESIDQFPAFLVSKVIASVFDTGMNVVQGLNSLAAFWRSLVKLAYLALDTLKVRFVALYPALPFYRFAIGQRGKGGQSKINANHFATDRQWLRFDNAGKTGVPIAKPVTLDGERFTLALCWPVQDDFNVANFRDGQPGTRQLKTGLFEREAIIPPVSFKTREAGFISGLDPAKESLKSQVNPFLYILKYLGMNVFELRSFGFPSGQHLISIIQTQRLLLLFPRIFTQSQRIVIDFAAKFKGLVQLRTLRFGWIEPVPERLSHTVIISHFTQITNCVSIAPFIPPLKRVGFLAKNRNLYTIESA